MSGFIAGFKSLDFYRKLKKDLLHELTESSTSGGMFCVCGTTRQVVVERSLRQ